MAHVLDNPIFNALLTGNKAFAVGAGNALFFQQDVAPFAGMETNSINDFKQLASILPPGSTFVIFSTTKVDVPLPFKILREFKMFQMMYNRQGTDALSTNIIDLGPGYVEQMLELTKLTNPGPFLQRTIEFTNYTGIFDNNALVAMAGHRMQPAGYVEISAVCTHPEHVGKGHAAALLNHQIKLITAAGKVPFLHVLQENTGAISVYKRLGFENRTEMLGYVCSIS
ncbi:GNAT family N-acetyltransferase [Mucilaginibacter litoreus]|uniref:GNAT family N-acetyltransferase n=1 Tax=Mucilaginibacter litoreus TaxID=1048221 RepID=A0ABW3ATF7_9SPHI